MPILTTTDYSAWGIHKFVYIKQGIVSVFNWGVFTVHFNFICFYSKISTIVPSTYTLKIDLKRRFKSAIGRSYFMPKRTWRFIGMYTFHCLWRSLPHIPDFLLWTPQKFQACNMRPSSFPTFQVFFIGNFCVERIIFMVL